MKAYTKLLAAAFAITLAISAPALVAGASHGGHGETGGSGHGDTGGSAHDHGAAAHDMHGQKAQGDHGDMDHSGHMGDLIREADVDGYQMAYHLIDMRQKIKGMKNMPAMKATHHLMVYIKDPQGQMVSQAQAGYLVENPDGAEQKAMTMPMKDGFGADINLSEPGAYTIKTKVMAGETKLMDSFEYEVK